MAAKNKGGRPTSFRPEYIAIAKKACETGMTDVEIADLLEVHISTLYRWKNDFPEFCDVLKSGKELADERVVRSLYQRATGYRQKAVKIFMPAGKDDPVYAEYVEAVPADTTAAIFWLKNRKPEEWRDKVVQEHTGDLSLFDRLERGVARADEDASCETTKPN